MTIVLNGDEREVRGENVPLPRLLADLNLEGRPVLVEHNGVAVHPRDFDATVLSDGDLVEIARIIAGG